MEALDIMGDFNKDYGLYRSRKMHGIAQREYFIPSKASETGDIHQNLNHVPTAVC